ncbi:MAG: Choline transport system permease protein OpuBB [Candidatus Anoxychlamydiales bacterium]|nr:Choline transport system permease protein OpuBB [Candidatus Anoxychlamydiales bacterium]
MIFFKSFFSSYILLKLFEHIQLSIYSILIAMMISIPLGIILAKSRFQKTSSLILKICSIIQTIPSLALIALLIVIMVSIRNFIHLPTIGFFPGILVLSTYAILPILANTVQSIKNVDPILKDVAKALGMTSKQILFYVELPKSIPYIITGIRISLIWTISSATLTSLVGSGGFGDLIMQGLRSMQIDLILKGTIPTAILAVTMDHFFIKLSKYLTPNHL